MQRPLNQAGRHWWPAVQGWLRSAVNFVYPAVCPSCGREDDLSVTSAETRLQVVPGPLLCASCREEFTPSLENPCLRCGAPAGPHLDTSNGCGHCREERFAFERAFCLGAYEGALRRACLSIKRPGCEPLAAALGTHLAERLPEALRPPEIDCVIPIPQHWLKRLGRSHNPAVTLAQAVARCLKAPCFSSILVKTCRTSPQVALPPSRRRTNLKDAFAVTGASVLSGQSVLLVDDILTTGTTAHEAAKVLKRAGAQRVLVAVLARGLGASRRVSGERVSPFAARTSRRHS